MMANHGTGELLRSYYDSWTSGMATFDRERLREILAPDLRFEGPIAGRREGREPFLRGLADFVGSLKAFRPLQQLQTQDEASTLYDCEIGASAGTLRFAEFFRIEDGCIREIKLVYDPDEFRRLIAAVV